MRIGFFDSGAGGLTVLDQFLNILEKNKLKTNINLDDIEIFYLADLINAPYGPKSSEELLTIIHKNIKHLESEESCDYIVSACNSASAIYSKNKNKNYTEMIRPTANHCKLKNYKKSLLLATTATVNSNIYKKEFDILNIHLDSLPIPMLASMIEEGESEDDIEYYIRTELEKYKTKEQKTNKDFDYDNYDNVILGCTHYPLVQHIFKKFFNQNILNPGIPVSEEIFNKLKENLIKIQNIENASRKSSKIKICFTLTKENKVFKNKAKEMFSGHKYIFTT